MSRRLPWLASAARLRAALGAPPAELAPAVEPGGGGREPAAAGLDRLTWREVAQWAPVLVAALAALHGVALLREPRAGLLGGPLPWVAVTAALYALLTFDHPPARAWLLSDAHADPWAGRPLLGFIALTLGGVAMATYADDDILGTSPLLVGAWVLAQVLWLAAFLPRPRLPSAWPRREALLLALGVAAVLAVAAALRLWHNDVLPQHIHGDSTSYGLEARAILAGQVDDVFGLRWYAIPTLGFVPTALSLALFGDNLHGLNTMPALFGLASLLALFLLGRELFGWRAALFALVLASGDLVHLHFSRIAGYMEPVTFVAWALYFLVVGLRRGPLWAFAASGLCAGYALEMYYAGRVVLPLLAVAVALAALAGRGLPRARWAGLAVAAAALVLALGPGLVTMLSAPEDVMRRTHEVLISSPEAWTHTAAKYHLGEADVAGILAQQVDRTALMLWKYDDGSTQFGMPRPWLDPAAGALLVLALGYALTRLRHAGVALVLAWAGLYLTASVLTIDPPAAMRMAGLALPVALLGGLALDRGLDLLPRGRAWTAAALTLGLAVTAASLARNWHDYLVWGSDPQSATPRVQIVRFLQTQPPEAEVRTVSRSLWWQDREFAFLLPDHAGDALDPDAVASGEITAPDAPTIYIVTPDAQPALDALRQRFPRGLLLHPAASPRGDPFVAYLVTPRGG